MIRSLALAITGWAVILVFRPLDRAFQIDLASINPPAPEGLIVSAVSLGNSVLLPILFTLAGAFFVRQNDWRIKVLISAAVAQYVLCAAYFRIMSVVAVPLPDSHWRWAGLLLYFLIPVVLVVAARRLCSNSIRQTSI